ncbi:MAG: hypothetical protein ACI35M_01285 [Alistipes sp.]
MKTTKHYTTPALIPLNVGVEQGFAASREWGSPKEDPSFDEGESYDL